MAPLSGVTLDAILKRNSLRRSPSGELYFRAFDGKLTALDLEIHKPLWVLQTNASKQNLLEFPTRTGPSFSGVVGPGLLRRHGDRRPQAPQRRGHSFLPGH